MTHPLSGAEAVERSLHKRFRKELWAPFIAAVKRYGLVEEGDRSRYACPGARIRCSWPS